MSQPETVTPLQIKRPSIQAGQAFITGRIHSCRKIDTKTGPLWLTVMKLAAADSYSHPATIEVRSDIRLGKPDDDWTGVVSIHGMANNYDRLDKDTGEREFVYSARNELTVVQVAA